MLHLFARIFAVTTLLASVVSATTVQDVEVTCPLDGTQAHASVIGSTFISGITAEFEPLGVGADLTLGSLVTCPACGLVAPVGRYEDTTGLDLERVRRVLREVSGPRLFAKHDRAIAIEQVWRNDLGLVARYTLGAKWLANETGEPAIIAERATAALGAHQALFDSLEPGDPQRGQVAYLIGELYRQQGARGDARAWFAIAREAIPVEERWLLDMQTFRLEHRDKPWRAQLDAARNAEPWARVAALANVYKIDAPEVATFAEDMVFRGPEPTREAAIDVIVHGDDGPPARYAPLYLRAIRDDYFRTAQGGARAVEELRIREAAPILIEALRIRDDAAEHRLAEAIAAVAIPEQIKDLEDLYTAKRLGADTYFRALLSTGSAEAVPPMLRLIARVPRVTHLYDRNRHPLKDGLAALAVPLLAVLPDPAEAGADETLSRLAVETLAARGDEGDRDILARLLTHGDADVALLAALRLSELGDARGKNLLVARIREVKNRDSTSLAALLPLLEPADFAQLRAAFDMETAERQDALAQLRKDASEAKTPDLKAYYEEQLRRVERGSDWWVEDWLRLFGATRNIEALPLLVNDLASPDRQVRAGAIDGLGMLHHPDAVFPLIALLSTEHPFTLPNLVRALGGLGDARAVTPLLDLMDEPTSVETKLAWIEAMERLERHALAARLVVWADSPHPDLSAAARASLARLSSSKEQ